MNPCTMHFKIKRAKNGYIIQCNSEESPTVFQEISDGILDDEVDAFASFLRHLNFEYGPSSNKYSRKRIFVDIRPGYACEDGWIRHTVVLQFQKGLFSCRSAFLPVCRIYPVVYHRYCLHQTKFLMLFCALRLNLRAEFLYP